MNLDDPDVCITCGHTLKDNLHGFDQNDGYLDEDGKLVLYGTCTYCKWCQVGDTGTVVTDTIINQ